MQTVRLQHHGGVPPASAFEAGFDGLRRQLTRAAATGAVGGSTGERLAGGCAAYLHHCHRDPAARWVALLDGPAGGRGAAGGWMEQMGSEIAAADRALLQGALHGAATALDAKPGRGSAAELQRIVGRVALALCAEEDA